MICEVADDATDIGGQEADHAAAEGESAGLHGVGVEGHVPDVGRIGPCPEIAAEGNGPNGGAIRSGVGGDLADRRPQLDLADPTLAGTAADRDQRGPGRVVPSDGPYQRSPIRAIRAA